MINLTDAAKQEFKNYFEGKEATPVRVYLADGGCSGMKLSLALDEVRDNDKSVSIDDFTFVINEELAEASGVVSVDMTEYGFTIQSEKAIGGGGCGCSSGGGCGSGGCG